MINADKKYLTTLLALTTVMIISVAILSIYILNPKIYTPPKSNNEKSVTLEKKIAYLERVSKESEFDENVVWLMNPDGTGKEKLDIGNVSSITKYPGQKEIIFSRFPDSSEFYIYNLETKEERSYAPFSHPDPSVPVYIRAIGPDSTSIDHSVIVLNVFYDDCEEEEWAARWFPCKPSDDDPHEDGFYAYDFSTGKSKFVGTDIRVSRWDIENKLLYYTILLDGDQDGLYRMNYLTGEKEKIRPATAFGYMEYPLLKQDKYFRHDGETEGLTNGYSRVFIMDYKSESGVMLMEAGWAEIQPFTTFNPSEQNALFEFTNRKYVNGAGYTFGALYKVDLLSNKVVNLTKNGSEVSFTTGGYWIDNENFITRITINNWLPEGDMKVVDYTSAIVKLNIDTGEYVQLTPTGKYSL